MTELNKSKKEQRPDRGSICKLCDRKFMIKEMVQGKLEEIKSHNQERTTVLSKLEVLKSEIQQATEEHRLASSTTKHEISTAKTAICNLREQLEECTTSNEHFKTEIEQGSRKKELI